MMLLLRCCGRLISNALGANSAAAECLGIFRDNSFARAAIPSQRYYYIVSTIVRYRARILTRAAK